MSPCHSRYPADGDESGSADSEEAQAAPSTAAADAAWANGANGDDYMLYDEPATTIAGGGSGLGWSGVNAAAGNYRHAAYFHRLDGDLLTLVQAGGEVRGQIRARSRFGVGIDESAQNDIAQLVLRVYRPATSSFVGTLLAAHALSSGTKFDAASTAENRAWPAGAPVTFDAVPGAVDGDYLFAEVGCRHLGPTSGGAGASHFPMDSTGSDLPRGRLVLRSWRAV